MAADETYLWYQNIIKPWLYMPLALFHEKVYSKQKIIFVVCNLHAKGMFINTLVGGLENLVGGQKSFDAPKRGVKKVFNFQKGGVKKVSNPKEGGSKMFEHS